MPGDDDKKKVWIEKLVGAVDAKVVDDAKAKQKQDAMARIRTLLEPNKEQIKSDLTFQMVEKGMRDKVLTSQGVGWEDQIETEDVHKYKHKAREGESHAQAGQDSMTRANEAWGLVTSLKDQLKGEKFPGPPEEDLFTDQDLADEFFEPLNREGLVPENLIPNEYSNVQKMQEETRGLYSDWVKEQQAAGNKGNAIGMQGIVSGVSGVGKSVAGIFGDVGEIAKAAITCIELTVNTGIAIGEGLQKSDYESIGDAVMSNVAKFVQAALTPYDKDLAEGIGSILEGAGGVGGFAMILATRDPLEQADVIEAIGKLGSGFASIGTGASGLTSNDDIQSALDKGATAFEGLFSNLDKFAGVYEALKSGNKGDAIKKIAGAINSVGGTIVTDIAKQIAEDNKDALEEQGVDVDDLEDNIKELGDTISESIDEIVEAASPEDSAMIDEAVLKMIEGVSGSLKGTLAGIVPALADAAMSVFQSRLSPGRVSKAFKEGKFAVGISLIGLALEQALSAVIPAPITPQLKKVATSVRAKYVATAKADQLKKLGGEGNWDGFLKVLTDAGDTATGVLKDFKSDPDLQNDPNMGAGMAELTKRGNDPAKAKQTNEKLVKQQEEEELERLQKAQDEFKEELKALENSDRSQRQKLALGEGGQEAIENKAIAKIIMKIQIKRAIIEAAAKMANGGMAIAAQFVVGVGIGIAALKFVQEVAEASAQALELNKWVKSATLAVKSGSMYEPAIQNFIGNREAQISHASIKAALAFTQMVLRSVELGLAASGIAAAGVLVTKVLDGATAAAAEAEDVIYEVVEKGKVESAWRMTRASLLNPNNRKLAKKAMKENHTWAKYAIAYGAYVKSDPIAVNAVNSIGLTQASLLHKETDVHKVRAYLEVVYNKDKQVIKESPLVADWLPKKVELSTKCLAAAQRRGEQKAEPKLPPPPPQYSKALASLARCDEHFSTYAEYKAKVKTKAGTVEEWTAIVASFDEYRTILVQAEEALDYLPKDAEGRPHQGMALFLKDLGDRAGVRKEMVTGLLEEARTLLEQAKAGIVPEPPKKKKKSTKPRTKKRSTKPSTKKGTKKSTTTETTGDTTGTTSGKGTEETTPKTGTRR